MIASRRQAFGVNEVGLLLVPLLLGTVIASDWARILGYAVIVMAPAVAVVAPRRILMPLVPTQIAVALLVLAAMPWVALAVAAAFVGAVASTGGLHAERTDTRHTQQAELPERLTAPGT